MHLDTCFLIDLQRENRAGKSGPAHGFLQRHGEEDMRLSVVVVMEYCEGFEDGDLWKAERFLRAFEWVAVDHASAFRASRIRRKLRLEGQLLPDNDILVAASALEAGDALVTDNLHHFSRIEALKVLDYTRLAEGGASML